MKNNMFRKLALACIVGICMVGCNGSAGDKIGNSVGALTDEIDRKEESIKIGQDGSVGDNLPVSRALAAKMMTLAFYDAVTIANVGEEAPFTDVSPEQWYYPYVNCAYAQGLMMGEGDKFHPLEPLTLWEAKALLDRLYQENAFQLNITDDNQNNPVSYALWCQMYKKALEESAKETSIEELYGIGEKKVVVLATPGNNTQLLDYYMITDKGPMTYDGLVMDAFIDMEILVQHKEGQIVSVLSVTSQNPEMKNCYIVDNTTTEITLFTGGAERTYRYQTQEQLADAIADVTIDNGTITNLTVYNDYFTDVIKKSSQDTIELETRGLIPFSEDMKVYSTISGQVKWYGVKDLIVGSDIADFIGDEGTVRAAVIRKKSAADEIRVALHTTGYGGLVHESVRVTSDQKFIVDTREEQIVVDAGEVFTVSPEKNGDLLGKDRLYIYPEDPTGKIQIASIKRSWPGDESPWYRGTIEIARYNGGYNIVNQLPLEDYLYAVVPSEMPSGYGVEASKVQAVTARSYAYNQLYANRFHTYGANVDDSVSCQVYNNIPENDTAIQGVDGTKGKCLTYEGQVVSANFFSTSSGMTANSGEVWSDAATRQFPAETSPYLQAAKQYEGDYGDLSNEENAAVFFKDTSVQGYDAGFNWFRWNVTMTAGEVGASINANLRERYNANPNLVKTRDADGIYRSKGVDSIGELIGLEITKRGQGGNIMEMVITGTEATVLVATEYNIRMLIRPYQYTGSGKDIILYRKDGTQLANYSLMPSAFYTVDMERDSEGKLLAITFYGGGNGHGVGMSQNGVKGMIDKGYSVEEILAHYYQGCQVSKTL